MEKIMFAYKRNIIVLLILALTLSMLLLQQGTISAERGEEVTIDVEGEPLSEQMAEAFRHLTERHVPTGILLDAGAIFFEDLVLSQQGSERDGVAPLTLGSFQNAYLDLYKSALWTELPTLDALRQSAENIRRTKSSTPIGITVLDYNSIGSKNIDEADFIDGYYMPRGSDPVGEQMRFVGTAPFNAEVVGLPASFIIPSSLFVSNELTTRDITDLAIQFDGGESHSVQFDKAFVISDANPTIYGELFYTLSFKADGKSYHPRGGGGVAMPRSSNDCYDIGTITASEPHNVSNPPTGFLNPFGAIDVRVIPGPGYVAEAGSTPNEDGCYEGGIPQLVCPLILVPDIIAMGNFSPGDFTGILDDAIEIAQDFGVDVVIVNSVNPGDYIQRNGNAVREMLVNHLPNWLLLDDSCVMLIGLSMGTQIARYGMRSAELAGEDHHVGLFISLDGPYQGANIPYSMIKTVSFLSGEIGEMQQLNSLIHQPAYRQLLLKNHWYQPHSEFDAYFDEVNAMGLPQDSRNVALANGSANNLQNNGNQQYIGYVDWNGPLWTGLKIRARTDHTGQVFYGKVSKFWSSYSWSITLLDGDEVDIQPGGYSTVHHELVEIAEDNGYTPAWYSLEHFNFVPTDSAIGAAFDATYVHKCNTEHILGTQLDGLNYILAEGIAFLWGLSTPEPPVYTTGCGQPEPGDPLPPTAHCKADPDYGVGSLWSTLDGSNSSDPDGTIVSYEWDFDDGSTGSGMIVDHLFENPYGVYDLFLVTLTVTDNDGMTGTDTCFVTVECEDAGGPFDCEY